MRLNEGQCRITLLGGLRLYIGERCVEFASRTNIASLLSYLAYFRDRKLLKDDTASILWPHTEPQTRRSNLRYTLFKLREHLRDSPEIADSLIVSDRSYLQLNPDIATDVHDFLHCIGQAKTANSSEQGAFLGKAKELYQDDLLPRCHDAWVLAERHKLRAQFLTAQKLNVPNVAPAARGTSNLPATFSRFFGREQEMELITNLLASPYNRLVTLIGPGGSGKTRLAIEAGTSLKNERGEHVYFVSLAALRDAIHIPGLVASNLLPIQQTQDDTLDQIVAFFGENPSILILDNVEHLTEGCRFFIKTLLARTQSLTLIATSRHEVGLSGERLVPVPPLPVPDGRSANHSPDELLQIAGVRLFVDRVKLIRYDFELTPANAAGVARICAILEGIPLAIELCTAWAQILTVEQIADQLSQQRFSLLAGRHADAASERHGSLWATVEYSYNLLTPELQNFFLTMAVFRGGWSLESAAALSDSPVPQALDRIMSLIERSMILTEETHAGMRYRMLESLREFAQEQWTTEFVTEIRQKHAEYFLSFMEDAKPSVRTYSSSSNWHVRIGADLDNLRSALSWIIETNNAEIGLRMVIALEDFWHRRGLFDECREWTESILAIPVREEQRLPRLRANRALVLAVFAKVCNGSSHMQAGVDALRESIQIWHELGDRQTIIDPLLTLADRYASLEQFSAARACLQQAEEAAAAAKDVPSLTSILVLRGNFALAQDDLPEARQSYEKCLEISKKLNRNLAVGLHCLSRVLCRENNFEEAYRLAIESLAQDKAAGNFPDHNLLLLAVITRNRKDHETSLSYLKEATHAAHSRNDEWLLARIFEEASALMRSLGDTLAAVRFSALSDVLRNRYPGPTSPGVIRDREDATAQDRSDLGEDTFVDAWERGEKMTVEEAVDEILAMHL